MKVIVGMQAFTASKQAIAVRAKQSMLSTCTTEAFPHTQCSICMGPYEEPTSCTLVGSCKLFAVILAEEVCSYV